MMPDVAALMKARDLMYGRRYEAALAIVLGLRESAKDHGLVGNPALSYTLGLWGELAERYAPAYAALAQVRDECAAALLAGPADRAQFGQVALLDKRLGDAAHTHALFQQVLERDPALASACAHAALPAMIAVGDFTLAERFLPHPEQLVRNESRHLNWEFSSRRRRVFSTAPRLQACIHNYAAEVRKLVTVLEGRGRDTDARRILSMAIDAILATTVRRAVRTALLPGALPWYARGRPDLRKDRPKERLRHRRRLAKEARKLANATPRVS
jgi:hypothetical protein